MTDQRWKWTLAQIALGVVAISLFVAVMLGTRDMPEVTRGLLFLSLSVATVVVGVFFDIRAQRHLDEMAIAAAGFAARWSTVAVVLLANFAIFFVPFHPVLDRLNASLDKPGPPYMFAVGVVAALVVKGLAGTILRAAWMRAKQS